MDFLATELLAPSKRKKEKIIEDFFTTLEKEQIYQLKIKYGKDVSVTAEQVNNSFQVLKNSLTVLDRNIEDLLQNKRLKSNQIKSIYDLTIQCIKSWTEIFKSLVDELDFRQGFSYNILGIAALLNESPRLNILDFEKDLMFFSPSRKDKINYDNEAKKEAEIITRGVRKIGQTYKHYIDSLLSIVDHNKASDEAKVTKIKTYLREMQRTVISSVSLPTEVSVSGKKGLLIAEQLNVNYQNKCFPFINLTYINTVDIEEFRADLNKHTIHLHIQNIKMKEGLEFVWDMSIVIKGKKFNSAQIGYFMWVVSDALESIDGVTVSLNDWGNGSKWMKIRLAIKNFFAKKEVKHLLNKSAAAAEAYILDKQIEGAGKLKAEKEKTEKEKDNLRNKDEAQELHRLEAIKLKAEIHGVNIDNISKAKDVELKNLEIAEKKMELFKQYSELIKDAALKVDNDFEFLINDMLFIKKEGDKLSIGKPIELIEAKEIREDNDGKG